MSQWRLSFDVPVSYAVECGYAKSVNSADFNGELIDQQNTYHEPVSGLLMLRPSHITKGFSANFQCLNNWTYTAGFWQTATRAIDGLGNGACFMTYVKPATSGSTLVQMLTTIVIIALEAETGADNLINVLTSNFTLAADEGFCIHFDGIGDEMFKFRNFLGLRWADMFLHISSIGVCQVYQYPRNPDGSINLTATPTLTYTFTFSSPGELTGGLNTIWLQPIPGRGVLFSHNQQGEKSLISLTKATHAGTVIPWPTTTTSAGPVVMAASNVNIAMNPYNPVRLFGFQNVRFPASGTFIDSPFDCKFSRSITPGDVTALAADTPSQRTAVTAASATLIEATTSSTWVVGDGQGRISMALSSSNPVYTPMVYGSGIRWQPVMTARATTQTFPAALLSLEYSITDDYRFDGKASCLMNTAAQRLICERGDTTWLLERSDDSGVTWVTVSGGLASVDCLEANIDTSGMYYIANFTLRDSNDRLRENYVYLETAFDELLLIDAINLALLAAGYNAINPGLASNAGNSPFDVGNDPLSAPLAAPPLAQIPTAFLTIRLPPTGTAQWTFSPRVGDSSEHCVDQFLFLARQQNVEYRLRFDWPTQVWFIDQKPRDTSTSGTWTLTAYADENNVATQTLYYETLTMYPTRPEANSVTCVSVNTGTATQDPQSIRSQALINKASLTDPTSVDYLGRVIGEEFQVENFQFQSDVDIMARRVFDATAHRRMKAKLTSPKFSASLLPSTQVNVRAQDAAGVRETLFTAWIKRLTVKIENNEQETVDYELDTVWAGELVT